MTELPKGFSPSAVPPVDLLDSLTDDQVVAVIDSVAKRGNVSLGVQFWIDELARRRAQHVLDAIAAAGARSASQTQDLAQLTADGAAQNAEMVRLNRRMVRLTAVSTVAAVVAVLLTLANIVFG